jgi:uncharacterized protein
MRCIVFCLLWALGTAWANPQLEAAVAAYDNKQLKTARLGFERLAQQGVPAAHYNLAVMHLRGELPRANPREALRRMTLAAEGGFVTAMVGMADLYEQGARGIAADAQRARSWRQRAAEAGSVESQVTLGTAFYLGRGAPLDKAAAAHWYQRAAQAGDVGAQYLYAAMLETGDGIAQDLHEARYWYGAAARSGDDAAPFKVKELDAKLGAQPRL